MTGASYLGPHADKLLGFDVPQLHDHAVADVGPRSVRDHELVRFYFLQCSEASVAYSQGARSRLLMRASVEAVLPQQHRALQCSSVRHTSAKMRA